MAVQYEQFRKEQGGQKEQKLKMPFSQWGKYCPPGSSRCWEYSEGQEGADVFDASRIGIVGEDLPGQATDTKNISGKEYEHDVLKGHDVAKIKVTLVSGERTLGELKKVFEGKFVPDNVVEMCTHVISAYFDGLEPKEAKKEKGPFLGALEEALQKELDAMSAENRLKESFSAKTYTAVDTPLDACGIDFFVEIEKSDGTLWRINCDITLNKNKDSIRGDRVHLLVGDIDIVEEKNLDSLKRVTVQANLLAQRILHEVFDKQDERYLKRSAGQIQ